jgi:hypothetical protein
MRRALLPDPNGQIAALDAVLRDLDRRADQGAAVDEIYCLGNLGSQACLERVKTRCARVLRGRHERDVLERAHKADSAVGAEALRTLLQLYGCDDAAALEKLRAPDSEAALAEELAKKAEHAFDLRISPLERDVSSMLKRMLLHPGLRGLVLKFMQQTRLRREGDEALRWLGGLGASARVDDAVLVHERPFPELDRVFRDYDWGRSAFLFFGGSEEAGVHADPKRPGVVAATPGSLRAGAKEATYLLWESAAVELVRLPVASHGA